MALEEHRDIIAILATKITDLAQMVDSDDFFTLTLIAANSPPARCSSQRRIQDQAFISDGLSAMGRSCVKIPGLS
tara:strand:+ start:45349 stop:45573 length:225 start_codon:yes stop_codon:yes gene_type:complete